MFDLRAALDKFFPLSGMQNWTRVSPTNTISLPDCKKLIDHLKSTAGIPLTQKIWDRQKIEKLRKKTKFRKLWFFSVFGAIVFVVPLTGVIFLLGIACALYGNECVSTMPHARYRASVLVFLVLSVGLLMWKRSIGRDLRKTNFEDYFHPDLTDEQRVALKTEILNLKSNRTLVYEVGNYESMKQLLPIFWRAENWFMALTENEVDRSAVWLDGLSPTGELYIEEQNSKPITTSYSSPWDELQRPGYRFLYSDIDRLKKFVEEKNGIRLIRNQPYWIKALEKLVTVYSDYVTYLKGEMSSSEMKEFENLFTPFFAEIARQETKRDSAAKIDDIGHKGAKNFLRGRNTSLEKWINTP